MQNFDDPEHPANSEDGDIPVGTIHRRSREPTDLLAGHFAEVQVITSKQTNLTAYRFQGKDRHHHRCRGGARQKLRDNVREARRERRSERCERGWRGQRGKRSKRRFVNVFLSAPVTKAISSRWECGSSGLLSGGG